MKRLIDNLLKALCDTYDDIPPELDQAACKVQAALESGVFNCLVEHPANKPPDDDRQVLCVVGYEFPGAKRAWRISRFTHGSWDCGDLYVCGWQELPLMPEVEE